jgi:excisionase family DNA binding protein
MESPFMTTEELAAYLRLSPMYVQQSASMRPHMLPPKFNHPGRRLLWHKDDVDAWIAAGRVYKEPEPLIDLRGWAKGLVKKPVPVFKNTSSPANGKKLDALEPLPRKPALR